MDSDLLLMLCVCDGLKIEDSDLFVKEIEDRDLFFVFPQPTHLFVSACWTWSACSLKSWLVFDKVLRICMISIYQYLSVFISIYQYLSVLLSFVVFDKVLSFA